MRRIFTISKRLAALVALAVGPVVAASCKAGPSTLLPDLVQVRPSAISFVQRGGRTLLVFASAVENVGRGPLLVAGTRAGTGGPMRIRQLVRRSDGSTVVRPLAGALVYAVSESHAHWHFADFDRYELRDGAGALVRPARKTGFCLGDRYRRASLRLPGEPAFAVLTAECGRGRPGLTRLVQGISVGYGDDYVPELEGQSIDVTGLPAGRYLLVHRVNAARALVESDELPGNPLAPAGVDTETDTEAR